MITKELITELCEENIWFTKGTKEQFERLLDRAEQGYSVTELAAMIEICSDSDVTVEDINDEIEKRVFELVAEQYKDHYLNVIDLIDSMSINIRLCNKIRIFLDLEETLQVTGRVILTDDNGNITLKSGDSCLIKFRIVYDHIEEDSIKSDLISSTRARYNLALIIKAGIEDIKIHMGTNIRSIDFSAVRPGYGGVLIGDYDLTTFDISAVLI